MSSQVEADRYKVEAHYKCSAQVGEMVFLKDRVRIKYETEVTAKGCKLESFKVTKGWMQWNWEKLWFEYHIKIEAIISGSPIPVAIVLAILAVIKIALIAVAIYLVGEEIIKPLFVPNEGAPLGIPSGWLIIGLIGLFLFLSWKRD